MKKAILTLAVLVMAFGNVGFAQGKAELKAKTTERIFKQYGLVRESYIVPQQATYSMVEGTQYRTTYYYDESEYTLTEEIMEVYGGDWMNQERIAYEYDFNGNVMEMMAQVWLGDDWYDASRASFEYDGDVISEVIYQFNMGGTWENQMKEVYNFNGDQWTVLLWTWNGNNWASSELYTYNRSGNTIEVLMQYMEGGAWQNEAEEIYTLDFNENVTEILYKEWNLESLTWMDVDKMTYVYEGGVYTDQYVQEWTGSAWADGYHYTYDYDGIGNAKHGMCFGFGGYDWAPEDGNIDMAYGYNAETKSFYASEVEMVYVDLTKVNENAQTVSFKVYPTPAETEIQIQAEGFQKAEIFTLTGQMMLESEQNSVNVSGLAAGLYLLKVYDQSGNSATQKLIVK